ADSTDAKIGRYSSSASSGETSTAGIDAVIGSSSWDDHGEKGCCSADRALTAGWNGSTGLAAGSSCRCSPRPKPPESSCCAPGPDGSGRLNTLWFCCWSGEPPNAFTSRGPPPGEPAPRGSERSANGLRGSEPPNEPAASRGSGLPPNGSLPWLVNGSPPWLVNGSTLWLVNGSAAWLLNGSTLLKGSPP